MTTTLPKTIKAQSTKGDLDIPVRDFGSTSVPDHDGGRYANRLTDSSNWDGFARDDVKKHLLTWSFPKEVKAARDRCEQILEEAIPNQKRSMLRNQAYGQLDQRWVPQIAIGQDVERPFQRWSKNRRETISVAVCIDAQTACYQTPDLLKSRMVLAAGLAAALEFLDYDVAIIGACMQIPCDFSKVNMLQKPREKLSASFVNATTCKDWNEPFADSGLAHFANTGLRRLLGCWVGKSNFFQTQLTDREWRELTQADLLIYIGAKETGRRNRFGGNRGKHIINAECCPGHAKIGPQGEDSLHLPCSSSRDIDPGIDKLGTFFTERFSG